MAMRASRTDAVLVLIAVVLVTFWFVLPRSVPEDRLPVADWSDIATHPPSGIVVRRGNDRIALALQHSSTTAQRYVVKNPRMAAIDPFAVDRLIRALGHLEVLRPVDAPEGHLALGHPVVEIELDTREGKRTISLGAMAPSPEAARYSVIVRDEKRQVVVIGPASAQAIDIEPDSLLNHRVLDWVPSELRRLEISNARGPITLERQDSGRWWLAAEPRIRARRATMDRLLLALTELSVVKLLEPSVAAAGLHGGPVIEISLGAKREEHDVNARLRLGGKCPVLDSALALTLDGSRTLAGCVEATALDMLTPDREMIVDDAAFSLHGDEVERLEVSGLGPTWTLEREGSAFRLTTGKVQPVPLSTGNGLLDGLVSIRGQVSGSCDFSAQRERPMLTLRSFVVGDDGPSSDRIRLGSVANDGRRKICRDDGSELVIGPNDAPMLDVDPTMLRDPNLLDVPFEAITEVRIETPSGRQLLRVDQHGGFGLVEPGLGPPDAAAIETLRDRLAHLHAERWLAPSDRRTASARAPNALIDFIVSNARPDDANREHAHQPQPKHHRLRLLLDDADQSVGWFDEDPTPFRIDAAFVKLINGLSHDQRGRKHRIDLPRR